MNRDIAELYGPTRGSTARCREVSTLGAPLVPAIMGEGS
jgi:hypothetical protein